MDWVSRTCSLQNVLFSVYGADTAVRIVELRLIHQLCLSSDTMTNKRNTDAETTRSPEQKKRGRGPSLKKTARTRAMIVQAAMLEFLRHGFAGTTMAAVAMRARVAKGTSYQYFPTKEALFAGVVREAIINPLSKVEEQPILPNECVGDYFRRTLLPVMRQIESGGRAAVARLVLTEGAQFPALIDIYRTEVYDPLLKHVQHYARLAVKRKELKDRALVLYPHLLVGPLWIGMIHNGAIDKQHPVNIGDMFAAHLDILFSKPLPTKSR